MFPRPTRLTGVMVLTSAGLVCPWTAIAGESDPLDPRSIPKYVAPLVIPPAMPRTAVIPSPTGPIDLYEIAVRQMQQQVLPPGMPMTTVWAYGSANHPWSFNSPGFTIEARHNRPVRVMWTNGLVDENGDYLPHLLPVDQTLHWANPPGPEPDTETMNPEPYTGPVPIVTHVHGANTTDDSDGYTEAWYLPAANNVGPFIQTGTWYDFFANQYAARTGVSWQPGSATYDYPNHQAATTLWYHDHALGITRLNVYAGMAGFYLLRGGPADMVRVRPRNALRAGPASRTALPSPAPAEGDAPGTRYYEVPVAIQDRCFNDDGSLFYPGSREFFDGFAGPYVPDSDISPIWNPEFFGNTMMVNGNTWPVMHVEARRYRLRLLNGCNSRFLILKIVAGDPTARPGTPAVSFWQIGAEQGFLPAPVQLTSVLMAPAERADVIVDFSGFPAGTELTLINEAPDAPFGGGIPGDDFDFADPETTGQVMRFVVNPPTGTDTTADPATLLLPSTRPREQTPPRVTRRLALLEGESEVLPDVGPRRALLGTVDEHGVPTELDWDDEITETPRLNATEYWEFHNFTVDAHPIHVHLVGLEVVDRRPLDDQAGGKARPAEPTERGLKDTVIAYPGEITRVKARFTRPGLYVWHCHILEHEDHEMMRPFFVGR